MDPGDFRRIFRQMFGIPDDYRHHRRGDFESESLDRFNRGDEESAQGRQEQFHLDENHRGRHFSVLTDPLEIHRYFEQQMDEMLKNFGFGFGGFGTLSEPREERGYGPMVLTPDDDPPSTNPRDFMLNDYGGRDAEEPRVREESDGWFTVLPRDERDELEREDREVDRMDIGELETLRRGGGTGQENRHGLAGGLGGLGLGVLGGLGGMVQGSSVSERTVVRGAGTETSRTTARSDGSREEVVVRRLGDREQRLTVTTQPDGAITRQQELSGLQEGDLAQFERDWAAGLGARSRAPSGMLVGPQTDKLYTSLWDKFFGCS